VPDAHVNDTAGDVHEVFLRVQKGARNKRKQQKGDNHNCCEEFLDLKALQLLIERFREVPDEKCIRKEQIHLSK
jgi:hypothetical protein